jgi:hypothetical protein
MIWIKVDFSTQDKVVWKSYIDCPDGSCVYTRGSSVQSSDGTKLYTIFNYNDYMFFYTFLIFDGSTTGTTYKGFYHAGGSNGATIILINNKLYLFFHKDLAYFVTYDLLTSTFGQYFQSVTTYDSLSITRYLHVNDYFMFIGSVRPLVTDNRYWLLSKAQIYAIGSLNEMELSGSSFSPNVDYPVIITSATPITSTNIALTTAGSFTENTGYTIIDYTAYSYETDVSYNLNEVLMYFPENYASTFSIDIPCSISGGTSITYSLQQNGANPLPTWVSIDSNTAEISIRTPFVAEDTTYSVFVRSTVGANTYDQVFNFVVQTCEVDNCEQWKVGDKGACEVCGSGYSTANADTYCYNNFIKIITEAAKRAAYIWVTSGFVLSVSAGSYQGVWSMINQYQMLLLLPVLGTYLPRDVVSFLQGLDYSLFGANFPPFSSIYDSLSLQDNFDWEQPSEYLEAIGIESQCVVVNQFKSMLILILFGVIHLSVAGMILLSKRYLKFINKTASKAFDVFTFGVYIRMFIEGFMLLYLAAMKELYEHDTQSAPKIISYIISVFIIALSLLFWVLFLYLWNISFKNGFIMSTSRVRELFQGTKDTKLGRLFILSVILKRIMSITWIVVSETLPLNLRLCMFCQIQIGFLMYSIFVRPLKIRQDIIIEIINESFFVLYSICLIYFSEEERWNKDLVPFAILLLSANGITVMIIHLVWLIGKLWTLIKTKWLKKKENHAEELSNHNSRANMNNSS